MKAAVLLGCAASFVHVSAAWAQAASAAEAPVLTAATLSSERLARLDSLLQQYVTDGTIAGLVALVLDDGKPVYEKAFGWQDRETRQAMRTDTLFRIASQTKALTSAAALILMEEGKLAVNTPVSAFIPQFAKTHVMVERDGALAEVPAKRPITVRDLLTHTSGYSYGTQPHIADRYAAQGLGPVAGYGGWYFADKNEPICTTMEKLASLPAIAQPGEAYVYGYSTDILGCVVERAAGESLEAVLRSRLLEPLGMKDTYFFVPPAEQGRLATVYASGTEGKAVRASDDAKGQGHYVKGPRRSFSGGAGLVSTARDYARFLEMIRNGGTHAGKRLMSERSVALMRTNQSGQLHSSDGLGFGFGFQTVERYGANGLEAPGAYGWGGAYGSVYRTDPASGITLLLMLQLMPNTTDVRDKFANVVYSALQ